MNELYILKKTVNCNGWTGIHVDVTLSFTQKNKVPFSNICPLQTKEERLWI